MKFLNCEMDFECPENWGDMLLSSDENVRHCHTCNQDVHFCHTVDDLRKAIDAKRCVTYISGEVVGSSEELDRLVLNVENLKKSEFKTPRVIRTTGLPAGYKGLQVLFEDEDDKDEWKS